jgi:rfaE bifunctional protein nucleotidyltransferase chain/domain
MATMLIAQNQTMESGSFMGDQLCSLKTAYLFVDHQPDVDRVVMSVSPGNSMHFLWEKFIEQYNVELVYDDWNTGDWNERFAAWDRWRTERSINGIPFDYYRELYLRIHGFQRQHLLCGSERGYGRRNIYQYWYCGQEHSPDELPQSTDWFDDTLIHHPPHCPTWDVYISPHAKTQGNVTFTFEFWADVVHRLIDAGVSVTVGYEGWFCEDLNNHPLYRKHWGDHRQWMSQLSCHKLVACGNTGTGWLAAACGVPMITMEPPNSQMPEHRYRECGLRNIVEVVVEPNAEYVARRIAEEVNRRVVMTSGCYDILHAGHVRHLERSRAMGTKLIVALNSDKSVRLLKGPDRPINPQHQRKAVLEALRCVDEVQLFDDATPMGLIYTIKPDIITAGFGYEPKDMAGREYVEEYGGKAVVTYQGDASNEPSTTAIAKRIRAVDVIEAVRAGVPYSVNPFDKLKLMADEFLSVKDLPGEVADLGTCRGGTGVVLRKLAPDKVLFLFDTWAGNPYDDELCHHKRGEWQADINGCKEVIGKVGKTAYCDGIFPHTVNGMECAKFCFVYIDMDTYQATRDALQFFWERMVPGGKIVVDDYGWLPCGGVKVAVDEYFPPKEYEEFKHEKWIGRQRVIPQLYTFIAEKP